MEPKRIFDTKQSELELDDSSDGDLVEVMYKLNNPATASSIITPTTRKNYLPTYREQLAAAWQRARNDDAYRRLVMIWSGVALLAALLGLWFFTSFIAPGVQPLTGQRLGLLQDNGKVLQRLVENFAVDIGHYPVTLGDLAKAGNLKDYNILRTNPLTRETGGPMTRTWCEDGTPNGTGRWIGRVGYESVVKGGRAIGYRMTFADHHGQLIKANGKPLVISQNAD